MGYVIIRQAPDTDEYIIWDTSSERPVAVEPHRTDLDARLDHTDLHGSSMTAPGWNLGHWDDPDLLYEQRGHLPRQHLFEAAHRLIIDGDEPAVWALLRPFDSADQPDHDGQDS